MAVESDPILAMSFDSASARVPTYIARGDAREHGNGASATGEAGAGSLSSGARGVISAIVLAAGTSSRMGEPKSLIPIDGQPLLAHVLGNVRRSRVGQIVVVLGAHADRILKEVPLDGASVVVNRHYADGMSSSIRAGVQSFDTATDGFLIVLGDQPFVAPKTIDALIEAKGRERSKIVVPTFRGQRGNPVLLDRALSGEVEKITGDIGCRAIFGHHEEDILEVAVDDPGILFDLDTPEQREQMRLVTVQHRPLESLVGDPSRIHHHADLVAKPEPARMGERVDVLKVALDLEARNEPFVLATVVRVTRPTSGKVGYKAIVRRDREVVGWIGGSCTESVLMRESLASLRDGRPRLVRLSKTAVSNGSEEGVVEYVMECHSGGAMDIYIEPHLPKPQLIVVGPSPIAEALTSLGQLLGYRVVVVAPGSTAEDFPRADRVEADLRRLPELVDADTYVAVATMGKYDETALQSLAASRAIYVGLVASQRRSAVVMDELRATAVPESAVNRIRSPAGLDFGAKTPEEIALSIMAEITHVRRASEPQEVPMIEAAQAGPTQEANVDVVCGMEVEPTTPLRVTHDGRTYLFCSEGCRARFLKSPAAFLV